MMASPAAKPGGQHAVADSWQGAGQRFKRLALLALVLNSISALLFITFYNRPVYDDPNDFPDVQRYARDGVSIDTIRHHRNPTGPTSFVWMAAGVRVLRGDALRDARLSNLFSWLILGVGMLLFSQKSSFPQLWYAALLVTLVFPHTVSTSSLILTEGPALLFALLGVLVWLEAFSRPAISARSVVLGILGGLSMGIAVTCRQYFLALLPAAILFVIYQLWRNDPPRKRNWLTAAFLSLLASGIPPLILFLIWKNFSSPGMVAGVSYQGQEARVAPNFLRPIVAIFYVATYLIPFTFPAMLRLKASQRRIALLIAVLGGAALTVFRSLFLQPGPLNSLIRIASRLPHGGTAAFAVISMLVLYNALSVGIFLWQGRQSLYSCSPAIFALLVIAFFIAEQIGVGGNLPFYDRYVLQVAPFLGLIAFTVLPRLTPSRLLALGFLSALSHFMLWRFAFAA